MKIKIVNEKDFTKTYRFFLLLKTIFTIKPFELVVIKEGLSKFGKGVDWLIFTNETFKPPIELLNFPFSRKRTYFKDGLVRLDQITRFLKKSEHAKLSSKTNHTEKKKVSMTIGYVNVIYPPLSFFIRTGDYYYADYYYNEIDCDNMGV